MAIEGDIQTLLGGLVTGRAYPLVAPDPVAKPYFVYQVISNVPTVDLDGPTGTENRRLQVDGYATSYAAVKTLELAAKAAFAAAAFTNIPLMTGDLYEADTKLYRIIMDYSIWE